MSDKDWKYYSYKGVVLRYSDIINNKYIDHQVFNVSIKKWTNIRKEDCDVLVGDKPITKLDAFKYVIDI